MAGNAIAPSAAPVWFAAELASIVAMPVARSCWGAAAEGPPAGACGVRSDVFMRSP